MNNPKTSEVITTLQEMVKSYGDLPFTISMHSDSVVVNSEVIYFGYDQFDNKSDEINIRNFPY